MKTNVRKLTAILGCVLILGAVSCEQKVKVDEQAAQVSKMSATIKSIKAKGDSLEKIYLATIDKIDSGLNDIRDKEGVLVLGSNSNMENGSSKKEQILNNIAMINDLLKQNKATIAYLQQSLAQYKVGKDELMASLQTEKERGETLEKQITVMKLALIEKDFTIAELNKTNLQKDSSIQVITTKNKEQETALNKTYFTSGTYKQLKDKKIIVKEGGVLGVTSAKVLSGNLDKKEFTDLDMLKDTTIQLTGKDPKIITKHPVGTYKLDVKNNDQAVLTIKDPKDFWSVSKYLVVAVR